MTPAIGCVALRLHALLRRVFRLAVPGRSGMVPALLALLALASSAPAGLPDVIERAVASGETLEFDLKWLRISGGSATMTIAPLPGDETKLRITSLARSSAAFSKFFHVRDEVESVVARGTFSTLRYRKRLREGRRTKDETTIVDPERGVAVRKGKETAVPNPVYDPLSLIYHLRTLDLTPGAEHQFAVVADGKVYSVRAKVIDRQILTTPAGRFRAVLVEPQMEKGAGGVFRDDGSRLLVWYSDDERHLPLQIRSDVKIGTITATLRAIRNGAAEVPAAEPPPPLQINRR
ncbi:MAG TPA: DUF3108 domain-containing protein [Thermoanaerobaculia bacterium]|nr:DUF3108 domain-containing protein [Thermoanaerobaculia bacterium]